MTETDTLRRERKAQADKVAAAVLECIHTLAILDALIVERPGDSRFDDLRHALGPWADNVRRSVAAIEPLRPLLAELLYSGTGLTDSPAAPSGPVPSHAPQESPLP